MNNSIKQRYDLYVNTSSTGLIKAAQAVLLESSGHLVQMSFLYTEEYREHKHAFALDPVQLPFSDKEINLKCAGGIPGVLDDYLFDDWGRKVLDKLAYHRNQNAVNRRSSIDTLTQLSNSRIGALQWAAFEEEPKYELGCDVKYLLGIEAAAQSVDAPESYSDNSDEISLLYLANSGSGVGGARPKALLHDGDKAYLAKFNRVLTDSYNNARVELACLQMAKEAGLNVPDGKIRRDVNGRDVLLLDRFDVVMENNLPVSRRHLMTINGLLKDVETQRDKGGVFRYDDIYNLVKRYSIDIETDLTQLLRIMLFNRSINNVDDHERNFSLISEENGYRLSPAYDMVPSLTTGEYPIAGYKYSQWPPKPSEVSAHGKIFGLPKTIVNRVADQIINAVEQWPDIASKNDVSQKDSVNVKRIISL